MRRVRSLAALLLLAFWLPATLHCDLEHAGVMEKLLACDGDCETDDCAQIESGHYKPTTHAVHVSAPLLLVCLDTVEAVIVAPADLPQYFPDDRASPPELARVWQFVFRAAPLPGAPSIVS